LPRIRRTISAAKALRKKSDDAAARAEELEERRAGADLATRAAQPELERFRVENAGELLEVLKPDAVAAARGVTKAVTAVESAVAKFDRGGSATWGADRERARL
jgi:hypothetical protein